MDIKMILQDRLKRILHAVFPSPVVLILLYQKQKREF